MHQRETRKLLALLEEKPMHALHASGGQVRRISRPASEFTAIYAPSPISDEYVVIVNPESAEHARVGAIATMVSHHLYEHGRRRIYVLRFGGPYCPACVSLRRDGTPRTPIELRANALRARMPA